MKFDIADRNILWLFFISFQISGQWSRIKIEIRPHNAMTEDDRYAILKAKGNWRSIASHMTRQFYTDTGTDLSRKTVANHLQQSLLYARKPIVCLPLARVHRSIRFQ